MKEENNVSNELKTLFEADQADRPDGTLWDDPQFREDVDERDRQRKLRILTYVNNDLLKTPEDYYYAAMLLQHGVTLEDFELAHHLAQSSMKMGYEPAKWLYAASCDRSLIHQGKLQKYGTQYRKEGNGQWRLLPVDPETSDDQRSKLNVPSLAEMQHKIELMNKRKENE